MMMMISRANYNNVISKPSSFSSSSSSSTPCFKQIIISHSHSHGLIVKSHSSAASNSNISVLSSSSTSLHKHHQQQPIIDDNNVVETESGLLSPSSLSSLSSPLSSSSSSSYSYMNKNNDVLMVADVFTGRLFPSGLVYQQPFMIRSYESGPDGKATMPTILNQLQETTINHFKSIGLGIGGFGSTCEMIKRDLIWVVHKLQVEVDCYPSWGDVVEVNTWICNSGKNARRCDSIIYDHKTGQVLGRAVSSFVIMNKKTRRLSKIPDEIKRETNSYFMDRDPIIKKDNIKIKKLDISSPDCIVRSGILSHWSDVDLNQHVNNVKYFTWIIESVPRSVLEDQWLAALTLEYRQECGPDNALQSLSAVVQDHSVSESNERQIELFHSLRFENGSELVRGRTLWRPRPKLL